MSMPYDRRLLDYVPSYYEELLESSELLNAEDAEFARLNANIDDLLLQFNVSTATWGLWEWERICGIASDANKTLGERRSNVKARLRGYGVVTKQHIKNVADGYYGGETEVTERFSEYIIVIKFTSSYGIPSNLSDLQAILREIIPAHLAIEYEFKFVTYGIFKSSYATYNDVVATTFSYNELITNGE
ncbi:putative phage tail protein [Lysinibacillus sp. NPDC093712]|uniref:putative phage tail protein n=1 Tax=Lysinibacillus sp. NPDC093712 TaxID=3390579 RepID=UPI003CFC330E